MHPRQSQSGGNAFMVVAVGLLAIVGLLALGEFAYAHFLAGEMQSKSSQLTAQEQSVSQDTVEGFLRLRNRLTSAENILSQHVALSQFFDVLESLTLSEVRFTSLAITVNADRTADVKMTGTAKSFNALAAQSAAFAEESRIKQAIFSGISADKNGVVSFAVTAKLDPKLVELPATVPSSWTSAAPATTAPSDIQNAIEAPATTTAAGATSTTATTTP